MNRTDIAQRYTIENGIIRSPGKFEGEPIWAPWFYHEFLAGRADDEDELRAYFKVCEEDVAEWPELRHALEVSFHEDDMGFTYWRTHDEPRVTDSPDGPWGGGFAPNH